MSEDPVRSVLARIQSQLGASQAMLLSKGSGSDIVDVIPTGIEVLDNYVLGVGGLPAGRMIEVYSEEGAGKTSFALQCIAGAQRDGAITILAETEQALDSERAKVFGCDLDRVILLQPGSIEETLQSIETTLHALPMKGPCALVVWDSIAATPTQAEIDEGLEGKDAMGHRARAMSKACRVLCPLAMKKRTVLLFINQTRDKIGVMFGDTKTTPGGAAVKFHSSVRLQLFSGKSVKEGKEHLGKSITFLATKNKIARPWGKASVRLDYASGFDNAWSTITHAKDAKILPPQTKVSVKAHVEALEKLGWSAANPNEMSGTGEVAWDETEAEAPDTDDLDEAAG